MPHGGEPTNGRGKEGCRGEPPCLCIHSSGMWDQQLRARHCAKHQVESRSQVGTVLFSWRLPAVGLIAYWDRGPDDGKGNVMPSWV